MSYDVDFLPAGYRQERGRRHDRRWRWAVVVVLLALLAAGAIGQRQKLARAEDDLRRLEQTAQQMRTQLQTAEASSARLQVAEARAELAARLQHRICATRLLAAIAGSLPDDVTLSRLELLEERVASDSRRPRTPSRTEASVQKPPHQLDLDDLSSRRRETAGVVVLEGVAADDVAISRFLSGLAGTALFDEQRLVFTDSYELQGASFRSFEVRLQVRSPAGDAPAEEVRR
ncbi:MAG: hypothetical protein KY476_08275 [Planctomycetes bacterium]|nr:hypothetical protein [Planctomycetota bacterium]